MQRTVSETLGQFLFNPRLTFTIRRAKNDHFRLHDISVTHHNRQLSVPIDVGHTGSDAHAKGAFATHGYIPMGEPLLTLPSFILKPCVAAHYIRETIAINVSYSGWSNGAVNAWADVVSLPGLARSPWN